MASLAILRPALHKVIHRYRCIGNAAFQEEQEWVSGDETEEDDIYSVYSDEYVTQDEYSDDDAGDDEQESLKRYTISHCASSSKKRRRRV